MRQSLDSAVAQISQGATKEIIKALEQVITDFNNNLTTQFGENFVQLNESVLKLLVWQENYKSTIEKTEMQLNKTMESLSATEKVITTIASENGKILDTYRSLGDLVKDSRRQIDELVKQTESLKSFNDKIEKSLSLQVAKFSEIEQSTKTLTDRISKSLSGQSEALKKLTDEIDEQLPKALGNLNKTLTSLTTKFADDYEAFLLKMNKLI
jgi:chromosome segregation ATPase